MEVQVSIVMANRKLWFGIFLLLGCTMFVSKPALAHVLISDTTKSVGAVLHIVPDDDPVAGENANLFFDIQTRNISDQSTKLTVTNAMTDETKEVAVAVNDNSVTAGYIFPTQGVYNLVLKVGGDKSYVFTYSQRVSRGTVGSALDKPSYPVANISMVFCGIAFIFLMIVMFNRRNEIKKHSTF